GAEAIALRIRHVCELEAEPPLALHPHDRRYHRNLAGLTQAQPQVHGRARRVHGVGAKRAAGGREIHRFGIRLNAARRDHGRHTDEQAVVLAALAVLAVVPALEGPKAEGAALTAERVEMQDAEQMIPNSDAPAASGCFLAAPGTSDHADLHGRMSECSNAKQSETSRSSPTSTTARRRSSTPCSGSPGSSVKTRRSPSGSWTRWTWSARRPSRSWPRTRPSTTRTSTSTSWIRPGTPISARRSSGR